MKYTARFPTEKIRKKFLEGLSTLPSVMQEQIWDALRQLERNPRPFGVKVFKQLKPPVYLYTYAASYRVRIGDWRVLYDVEDATKTVWVYALRKRNEQTYK